MTHLRVQIQEIPRAKEGPRNIRADAELLQNQGTLSRLPLPERLQRPQEGVINRQHGLVPTLNDGVVALIKTREGGGEVEMLLVEVFGVLFRGFHVNGSLAAWGGGHPRHATISELILFDRRVATNFSDANAKLGGGKHYMPKRSQVGTVPPPPSLPPRGPLSGTGVRYVCLSACLPTPISLIIRACVCLLPHTKQKVLTKQSKSERALSVSCTAAVYEAYPHRCRPFVCACTAFSVCRTKQNPTRNGMK